MNVVKNIWAPILGSLQAKKETDKSVKRVYLKGTIVKVGPL